MTFTGGRESVTFMLVLITEHHTTAAAAAAAAAAAVLSQTNGKIRIFLFDN